MSLIFQSLQKLDANPTADTAQIGNQGSEPVQSRNQFIRWAIPILIGLLVVLALGCGAVYAVQYLRDRVPERERQQSMRERRPAPLETSEVIAQNKADLKPPAQAQAREDNQALAYQFHPPDTQSTPPALPPVAMVDTKSSPEMNETQDVAPKALPLAESEADAALEASSMETVEASETTIDKRALEAAEKARRVTLEKSARIGRLVRKIEQALAGASDTGDPQILLDKLARIKGKHHPYVAKLRAYWNVQRGNYDLAENDLHKVIAVHPDDLEAGINLALIEIHHQHYGDALKRLKQLRQVYPENAQIADLVKRLR